MRFFPLHSERPNENHGVQCVRKTKVIIMALCNADWRLNLFICIPPKSSHAVIAPFACNEHKISRTPLSSRRPHEAVEEFFFSTSVVVQCEHSRRASRRALFFVCVKFCCDVCCTLSFLYCCCYRFFTSHHSLVFAIVQIKSGESLFVHLLFGICIGLWFYFCFRFFCLIYTNLLWFVCSLSIVCGRVSFASAAIRSHRIGTGCAGRDEDEPQHQEKESTFSLIPCQI